MCLQYIGGAKYMGGAQYIGGVFSILGGYPEHIRGYPVSIEQCSVYWGRGYDDCL